MPHRYNCENDVERERERERRMWEESKNTWALSRWWLRDEQWGLRSGERWDNAKRSSRRREREMRLTAEQRGKRRWRLADHGGTKTEWIGLKNGEGLGPKTRKSESEGTSEGNGWVIQILNFYTFRVGCNNPSLKGSPKLQKMPPLRPSKSGN